MDPHDNNEEEDCARSKSDNGNCDPAQQDPSDNLHKPRRHSGNQGSMGPHRPKGLVAPASNLHVKCPIFFTKTYEDAESHLSHKSEWKDSQVIVEE